MSHWTKTACILIAGEDEEASSQYNFISLVLKPPPACPTSTLCPVSCCVWSTHYLKGKKLTPHDYKIEGTHIKSAFLHALEKAPAVTDHNPLWQQLART